MKKSFLITKAAIAAAFCVMTSSFLSEMQVRANTDEEGVILGGRLIADMSDLKCDYFTDVQAQYGERTMRGATAWNSAMNPLLGFDMYWSRVFDGSTPTVSVYLCSLPNSNIKAVTYGYSNYGDWLTVDMTQSNWRHCEIYLNDDQNPSYVNITHEFGHVLGLGENNDDPYSIMCQESAGRVATKPAVVDIIALNRVYSGYID